MKIELVNCTQTLLDKIGNKVFKRKDVAATYALAIRSSEPTDFALVNKRIIERWSRSGLEFIKNEAWKIAEAREKDADVTIKNSELIALRAERDRLKKENDIALSALRDIKYGLRPVEGPREVRFMTYGELRLAADEALEEIAALEAKGIK